MQSSSTTSVLIYTSLFIQRASEASEADSQSCSIEISDIDILVVCLSTNGERALNYTIVIQTTKIKLSC